MINAADVTCTEHKPSTTAESSRLPADACCQQPLQGISTEGWSALGLAWADSPNHCGACGFDDCACDNEPPCGGCGRAAWDHPDGHCHNSNAGYTPEPGARPTEDEDREGSSPAELDAELAAIVATNDARIAALPFDLRLHAERLAGAMRAYPSLAEGFQDALTLVFLAAQWRDRVTALWAELNPAGAANHTTGLARRRTWAKTDASRIEIEQRYSRYLWRWAQRNARFLFVDHVGQPLHPTLVALIRPTAPGNYSRSQGAREARRTSTAARRMAS